MSDHEIWQLIGRVVFATLAIAALISLTRRRR